MIAPPPGSVGRSAAAVKRKSKGGIMVPRPSRVGRAALAGVVLTALALIVFVAGGSASLEASSSRPAAVRVVHAYPVTLVTGDRLPLHPPSAPSASGTRPHT